MNNTNREIKRLKKKIHDLQVLKRVFKTLRKFRVIEAGDIDAEININMDMGIASQRLLKLKRKSGSPHFNHLASF